MDVGRPERRLKVAGCGLQFEIAPGGWIAKRSREADVVDQCIEPDVGDVIFIEGDGNSPIEPVGRAGDTEVFENIVLQEAENLFAPMIWSHERRIFLEVINQPRLVVLEKNPSFVAPD